MAVFACPKKKAPLLVWKVCLSLIPCCNIDFQTKSLGNSSKLKNHGGPVSLLQVSCDHTKFLSFSYSPIN
jgi:hypothetical protein